MTDLEYMDLKNYLNLLGFTQIQIKRITGNKELVEDIFYNLRYLWSKEDTKQIVLSLIDF